MAYLLKSRHGVYYFRMAVPERYRQAVGRGEIRRSLGTKSVREANRLLPKVYLEVTQSLEGIEVNAGPLLSSVLKEYLKHQERQGYRIKTMWEKEFTSNLLIKIAGNKPIEAYTLEDARTFRETVLQLPPRFNKLIQDEGLSIKLIIKKNAGKQTLTLTSYNNYIRALSAVFSYAVTEGLIEKNIFKGLKISQKVRASSFKDAFNKDDVKKLFGYVEELSKIRADRYWLTYLGLYTGARLGELCQLAKDDIVKVNGIDCIHIREGKEYQNLKNTSSERLIPIHSKLVSLGFLEYVKDTEGERVFPMLNYSKRAGFSTQPSQWFSKTIKDLGLEGKVSYHSLRHLVATILKQKGIDVSLTASLLGHSTGTLTYDRYGKTVNVEALVPVVEAITF